MVLGVLVAQWIRITTPLVWITGETAINLQEVLDGIMPSMLPLIVVMILVRLLGKHAPTKLIAEIFAVALVLSLVGFLS